MFKCFPSSVYPRAISSYHCNRTVKYIDGMCSLDIYILTIALYILIILGNRSINSIDKTSYLKTKLFILMDAYEHYWLFCSVKINTYYSQNILQ